MRNEDEILSSFGEEFITEVRDRCLSDLNMIISGKMKSEQAQKLHEKIKTLSDSNVVILEQVVKDFIDRSLFKTLSFFEESEDFIIGCVNEEEFVDLNEISDGLGGELFSNRGWIKKYSEYPES